MPDLIVVALVVALAAGLAATMLVLGAFAFLRTEQLKRALTEAYDRINQLEAQGPLRAQDAPARTAPSSAPAPVVAPAVAPGGPPPRTADASPIRIAEPAIVAPAPAPPPIPQAPIEAAPSRAAPAAPTPPPHETAPPRPAGPSLQDRVGALLNRVATPAGAGPAVVPEFALGLVALVAAAAAALALFFAPETVLPKPAAIGTLLIAGLGALAAAAWRVRRVGGADPGWTTGVIAAGGFAAIGAAFWVGRPFFPPPLPFAGVLATTLLATAAGYRLGRLTFGLGWLAGLFAPFASEARPESFVVFGAILALTGLGLAITTLRGWRTFALLGFLGALAWAFAWTNLLSDADGEGVVAGFLVALAALALAAAWDEGRVAPTSRAALTETLLTAHLVCLVAAAILSLILLRSGFAPAPTAAAVLMIGGIAAAAAARQGFGALPLLFAPGAALLLALWPDGPLPATVDAPAMFFTFAGALALAFAAGGWAMLTRNVSPLLGATVAAATPALLLAVVYLRAHGGTATPIWIAAGLGLALINGVALTYAVRAKAFAAAAPFSAATAASAALALSFGLSDIWLPAGIAAMLPAIAWLDRRLDLDPLKAAATALAAAAVWLLTVSLAPLSFEVAPIPIANQLLAGYGVAILAFWGAARLFDRVHGREDTRLVQALEAGALLLLAALLFMQVRHLANGFDIDAPYSTLGELGGQTLAALALAGGLAWQFGARARPMLFWAEAAAFAAALAHIAVVGLFVLNPWWGSSPGAASGPPLLSSVMFAYGLPALGFAGYAALRRGQGLKERAAVAGGAAIVLGLLSATLETRRLFHPNDLAAGPIGTAEGWSLFLVWAAAAALVFAAGVRWRSMALRGAGVAIGAAALAKGFLIDAPALQGLIQLAAFAALIALTIGASYAVFLWGLGQSDPVGEGREFAASAEARRP